MHEHHLAVWLSFAYGFQTAGDIYVIFWELLAQIVISLITVTASENKVTSLLSASVSLLSLLSSIGILWPILTTFYRGKLNS